MKKTVGFLIDSISSSLEEEETYFKPSKIKTGKVELRNASPSLGLQQSHMQPVDSAEIR